jgi:transcriptional regulator with XRE-family HTH domain
MKDTFGAFISEKRSSKQISLRAFSRQIGISPEYLSKIENGLRYAPKDEVLERIANVLLFSPEEKEILYDLAAESKQRLSLASDLIVYINETDNVHTALRLAKRSGANEEDWQKFIAYLSKKYL